MCVLSIFAISIKNEFTMAGKIGGGEFRVKEILKEKGIKMKELAVEIGITPESLTRALQGNPQYLTLKKIANYLGVPVKDLFRDENVTKTTNNNIKGCVFVNEQMFSFNSRTELEDFLFNGAYGVVNIPSSPRQDTFKNTIIEFCSSSINKGESGAMMMRYGVNEVFALTFDSESKKISLTQCIGNGVIRFNTFNTPAENEIKLFVEQILSQIESVYEIGEVW
jgi:transcriptional regulator with XRE-family HTH domain